jgi:hypothetical protein
MTTSPLWRAKNRGAKRRDFSGEGPTLASRPSTAASPPKFAGANFGPSTREGRALRHVRGPASSARAIHGAAFCLGGAQNCERGSSASHSIQSVKSLRRSRWLRNDKTIVRTMRLTGLEGEQYCSMAGGPEDQYSRAGNRSGQAPMNPITAFLTVAVGTIGVAFGATGHPYWATPFVRP